eukprot:jgi/Tetstr1/427669/TSEL_017794.t1
MDPLLDAKKGGFHFSPARQSSTDSYDDPLSPSDFRLRAVRRPGGYDSHPASPSAASPSTPTPRGSRSPFARAAKRSVAANGGSPRTPGRRSNSNSPGSRSRGVSPPRGNKTDDGFLSGLDDLTADFGDFVDRNFLEILYGIAIAMVLVVLVTSLIARAYIPPYRGWDSERAIYISATWYSSVVLVLLVGAPLVGPMTWNAYTEFRRLSTERSSKQRAALRAFRKGWKTGIIFYDRIGDRLRKMCGLPPMQLPQRPRLCV